MTSRLIGFGLLAVILTLPNLLLAADVPHNNAPEPALMAPPDQPDFEAEDPFDDPFAEEEVNVFDPIEPLNRGMFWFNDKLYFYLLKPVARGYRVIPEPTRISVDNFFSNLATPIRLVNALLQFKFGDASSELGRFGVNTTVGLLGFFDPAQSWFELEKKDEDFGQTLGVYGAGPGFYLVLPIFGPSSLRDGIGKVGDYFVDPISSPWYFKLRTWEKITLKSLDRVNAISLDKDTYEGIKKEQLDPYLFVRDAYLQYRAAKIRE
jgi:phospholipid-binding lipoprotein MlaA